jgi:hypothetical protein
MAPFKIVALFLSISHYGIQAQAFTSALRQSCVDSTSVRPRDIRYRVKGGAHRSSFTMYAASSLCHRRPRRESAVARSLIAATDSWGIWSALTLAAAAGARLGRTKLGNMASPPVCAMAIGFLLGNIGVLPMGGSPHIATAQQVCVRVATPLLLLR